jgi:8-oxo-dGTP diphosphatase
MTHKDAAPEPRAPEGPHAEDVSHAPPTVLVAAAVVIEEGRVLVTQRKAGAHLEGLWEFPGGKVRPGEDPRAALSRELMEEVGIAASVGEILDVTFHRYEPVDKTVLLLFFEARRDAGSAQPRALDVAAWAWATGTELDPTRFPPADGPVLEKVKALLRAPSSALRRW